MSKKATSFVIVSLLVLAVFNVICFVIPAPEGYIKYDSSFWIGYVSITVAIIVQIICGILALKDDNLTRTFYRFPLLKISYTGLIIMFIVGVLVMIIPDLPWWAGVIVCVLVLLFTLIALIKASTAASIIEDVDNKVATQTNFIRSLTSDAKALVSAAEGEQTVASAKKVYEVIRFSDPMSNPALTDIEFFIQQQFDLFSTAVRKNDSNINQLGEEVIKLVSERNAKCKTLK